MAESTSNRQGLRSTSIESLVEVLINHPVVRTAIGNRGNTANQASQVQNSIAEVPSQTSQNSYQSPQQEFTSIFNRSSLYQPRTSRANRRSRLSPYFRNAVGSSTSTITGSSAISTQAATSGRRTTSKLFHREVVLLETPEERKVLRGSAKANLVRKEQVKSMMEIDKAWTSDQVLTALQDAFKSKLLSVDTEPKVVILMAVGSDLVEPNLLPDQHLDGEMINRLFSQRTIWLAPKKPIHQISVTSSVGAIQTCTATCTANSENKNNADIQSLQTVDFLVEAGIPKHDAEASVMACGEMASPSECTDWLFDPETVAPRRLTERSHTSLMPVLPDIFQENENQCKETTSLKKVLREYAAPMIDKERPLYLEVERSGIWKRALTFYKQAMMSPNMLQKKIIIEFLGEEGVDAGALKAEFFGEVIKEMDKHMFEGLPECRVPKKTFQGGTSHIIAGMIIGHSLLQNGPAYPCLAPLLYAYIATGCQETALTEQLPSISNIPLNAGTSTFHEFITKIDNCNSEEELNGIFNDTERGETFMEIVNGSGWPVTEAINMQNKANLLQQLVVDELLNKRKTALDEIRKGLRLSGLLPLLESHQTLIQEAFVYTEKQVTPTTLKEMLSLSTVEPKEYPQFQAYVWFMEFIDSFGNSYSEENRLESLLQFWTGYQQIPPMGLPHPLKIEYLADDHSKVLPEAHTCFGILQLPVVHTNKDQFFEMINKAIDFGSKGFDLL